MKSTKGPQFQLERKHLLALLALTITLGIFIHLVGLHYQPWTSVVGDLNHDGQPDIGHHATAEQCVSYIHSLGVSGQCRLRCDHMDHCIETLPVADSRIRSSEP